MAWHGYLCFGGVTIIDDCMTHSLQGNGHGIPNVTCADCSPCCSDLNRALGRGGPGGPNIAQAPWYDPQEPRSLEFAGIIVTEITGFHPGPLVRSVSENVAPGAQLGQPRRLAPQMTVTGILAGSCCGAEYGLEWLQSALRGPCSSGDPCNGTDLEFLVCEPTFRDEDCVGNDAVLAQCLANCQGNTGCEDVCNANYQPIDYEEDLKSFIRKFRNVALIAGPEITNRIPRACPTCADGCSLLEIQFTLAAGDPNLYREEVTLIENLVFSEDPENDECIEFVPATSGLLCGCPAVADCATDPNCVDVDPPSMPTILNSCVNGCLQGDKYRVCATIPDGTFPANGSGTLRIEIFAGDAPIRNLRMLIWHNPLSFPPEDLSECDACSGLAVSYIAPDSTLEINGAARTALITCPGGKPVRANPFIAADDGPLFTYPEMEGCAAGEYTVCFFADAPVSNRATVSVYGIGYEG